MDQAPRRDSFIERLEARFLLAATEMVRNGGFEGTVATADWVRSGNFQADSRFSNVHTGAGYAYLANTDGSSGNSISGTMYQELTIPSTATSASINFWAKITTSETTTTAQNDLMSATIRNAAGTTLQTLNSLSNLNASTSYLQHTFSLSSSLIGQTIRIFFSASTNATLATTFRVDDVSLNAELPGSPPPPPPPPTSAMRIVGYLPYYRQSSFSKIDLSMLTHINYFSIQASADGTLTTPNVNDSNLATVVNAMHAAGKTVSICVGPISFSTLAASATARTNFANNILTYLNARNLDGVDIDWEPPAGNNVANYGLLIDELYAKLSPTHKLITAAVNPWTNEIPVAQVNAKLDWLNVMCYDFAPANHSTYTDAVSGMVDWTNYGVQKSKIVMGVPFYGRSGTTWSNNVSKTYPAILSDYFAINGVYPGPDVDSYVDASGATYYFNGVTTMQKKMAYIRDNGYGGAMTWELGQDRWNGTSYDTMSLLPIMSAMLRPPAWLSPAVASRFNYVNNELRVSSGSVTLSADAGASNPNLVSVTGLAGSNITFNTTQHLKNLTLESGSTATVAAGANKALVVKSLAINGGKLDIKNNSMAINWTGTNPLNSVKSWITTGRGGVGFATGNWNGASGIVSTSANGDTFTYAIGYAQNDQQFLGGRTSFAGQQINSNAILIKFTRSGDANLDGVVNNNDVTIVGSWYTFDNMTWMEGDFDYDGSVDNDDVTYLGQFYDPTAAAM